MRLQGIRMLIQADGVQDVALNGSELASGIGLAQCGGKFRVWVSRDSVNLILQEGFIQQDMPAQKLLQVPTSTS